MTDEKEKCYKDRNVWLRGLFMLLFVFLMGVAKFVTLVVVAVQFLQILFTGKINAHLLTFGKSLSLYQYQVMLFLTYNSDVQPFPMQSWPEGNVDNPLDSGAESNSDSSSDKNEATVENNAQSSDDSNTETAVK